MSEVIVAALTALFGVIVFVVGQGVQRFILEPIWEQRRLIGEVAYAVVFYANVGDVSSEDRRREASKALRTLAAQLRSTIEIVPRYEFMARRGFVREQKAIQAAARGLVGLSNSVGRETAPHVKEIVEALKLDVS